MVVNKLIVALVLALCGSCTLADLTIELSSRNDNVSQSLTWSTYQDLVPFRSQYANLHSSLTGVIHQPIPNNACSYIEPLPSNIMSNFTFALVDNYTSCIMDMITNVRNAGYRLIIASSPGNAHRTVTKEIKNSGFPVAIVTQEYAAYLKENNITVGNVSDIDFDIVIEAKVSGSITSSVVLMACLASAVLMCCCCCCCCCIFCCQGCSRERDMDTHLEEIEERRRTFEQHQRRERYARQELIESILRQLAELQVDLRSQIPLGEQDTKRLPTRVYKAGSKGNDTCAICVDDFAEGEDLRVLPCDHSFHSRCIDEWLIHHSSLCPLCKMEVPRRSVPEPGNRPIRINNFTSDDDSSSFESNSTDSLLPGGGRSSNRSEPLRREYGSV